MKYLLLLLCLSSSLHADEVVRMIVGSRVNGWETNTVVGEYVLQDSNTGTVTSEGNAGSSANIIYVAQKFVAGGNYTVTKIEVDICQHGTPTFNVVAGIYSHNGGTDEPDALVGSWSGTVAASSLPATTGTSFTAFTGQNASLTSGTTYWVVIKTSAYDTSNYIHWGRETVASSRYISDGDGTTPWTGGTSTTREAFYKLYSGG